MEPAHHQAAKLPLLEQLRKNPREALLAKARRALDVLRAKLLLHRCRLGKGVAATGFVQLDGPERITLGDRVTLLGGMVSTHLACSPGGEIVIGDESLLNYGVVIDAHLSVKIGRRCMLASYVRLADRGPQGTAAITIGDDVWIAHGAIIEPGVNIGRGSVISAGSVVTKDVPPQSMAIGNPARVMSLDAMSRE